MSFRIALIALLLTVSSAALHAGQPSFDQPGQHSALPWLDLKKMSATRDRPLFVQDRRKFVPPVAVVPAASRSASINRERKRPQLTLMGIIDGPDGTFILLQDASTSNFLTVRSGENIGAWRVVADGSYGAKLINGKDEITLEIFATP